MKIYKEIIRENTFNVSDEYLADISVYKMCWGCETKLKAGQIVWDAIKLHRIFFCEDLLKN